MEAAKAWPALRRSAIHSVRTRGMPRRPRQPELRRGSARSSLPEFEDHRSRIRCGSVFRSRPGRQSRNLPRFEKVRRQRGGGLLGRPLSQGLCKRSGGCRQPRSSGRMHTTRPNENPEPELFCLRRVRLPGGSLPACQQCADADGPCGSQPGARARDPVQKRREIRERRTRFSDGASPSWLNQSRVSEDRGQRHNREPRIRA